MTMPAEDLTGGTMPVDMQGVVTTDVPCKKCGYNLRGLSIAGRCPECATAVGLSVRGDFLQFADPEWVLVLRRGVNLILYGIVLLIVGAAAGIFFLRSLGVVPLIGLSLIGSLMMTLGGWLLTTPDPSGLGEEEYGTARKLIRVCLLIGVASQAVNLVQAFGQLPPMAAAVLAIFTGLARLASLIGQFAQLNYLSKLARRIPNPKLAQRARFLMWAIGISYGVILITGLMAAFLGFRGSYVSVFSILLGLAGLCLLVFGIVYLLMLERFARQFKEQAAIARSSWAGGGGFTAAAPLA